MNAIQQMIEMARMESERAHGADLAQLPKGRPATGTVAGVRAMARDYAKRVGVPAADLMANDPGRKGYPAEVRKHRNRFWAECREVHGISPTVIARAFGGLNHATVYYGIEQGKRA